jgi:uncharacterized protein (DUF2164 family)
MMSKIEFFRGEQEIVVRKVQLCFKEELDQDIGQFDAEFLLDFVAEELGAYFYNRGLYDAQAILQSRLESVAEAIYELRAMILEFLAQTNHIFGRDACVDQLPGQLAVAPIRHGQALRALFGYP